LSRSITGWPPGSHALDRDIDDDAVGEDVLTEDLDSWSPVERVSVLGAMRAMRLS
jgi:hypothetical protein